MAQVAILQTDTRQEAWAKETLNNSDLQTNINGKADALGADDNYVTDAEKTVIGNTSGTNTGDQDLSGLAGSGANTDITSVEGATSIDPTDGTYTHIIKAVNEPGLGGRLTFGLDETARRLVVCDSGDVDTDFGLVVSAQPNLNIRSAAGTAYLELSSVEMKSSGAMALNNKSLTTKLFFSLAAGNANTFGSNSTVKLTDTNGEQSMVYIEPKIAQSSTAAYNGLKVNALETTIGDGSTGDGNNIINLQVDSVTKARINNVGSLFLGDQAAASADVAAFGQIWVANSTPNELWFTDDAGTDTQLSSHPIDAPPELYTNLPGQDFIGVKRHKLLGIIQWQTLDGVITEETFAAYNLRRKGTLGHKDLVQINYTEWLDRHKESFKQKFIKENITEIEIQKNSAFDLEDVEERVVYDVEKIKDGVTTIVKEGKKIDETISYELSGDVVKEKKEPVWEMKIVKKPILKETVRFDETTGKFFAKVEPTKGQIGQAVKDFVPEIPDWIAERL